jgi:retron-type reverse transcriptase
MCTQLGRLTELARTDRARQFCSIAHLLTPAALMEAFHSLRQEASAGVDGVTYREYAADAPSRISQLHARLRAKQYRVQPLRRVYIPKEDGRQRPISIPTVSAYCTSSSRG